MKVKKQKNPGSVLFNIINYSFLSLFALCIIFPFWNLFILSFSDATEASTLGFKIWTNSWNLSSYRYIFSESRTIYAYTNTIVRTVLGTLSMLVITFMAAYPLSKKKLPGKKWLTTFFVFTMFFRGGMVPEYLLIRKIGLVDNRLVYILPVMVNVFYIIVARNYLMTIDEGVEESALIDGADYITILLKIIMPIAKPVIAVVGLWGAVFHWNQWFDSMIYIRSADKVVMQMLLRNLIEHTTQSMDSLEYFNEENSLFQIDTSSVKAAVILVTIGPIIFVYPFVQKYFIKGVMLGSIKG